MEEAAHAAQNPDEVVEVMVGGGVTSTTGGAMPNLRQALKGAGKHGGGLQYGGRVQRLKEGMFTRYVHDTFAWHEVGARLICFLRLESQDHQN